MKLYAITKGCYSDYHICGIATSKEKAEKMVKFFSTTYDEAVIEEFEANKYNDKFIGKQLFKFILNEENNSIDSWGVQDPEDIDGSLNQTVIITPTGYGGYYAYVWAIDSRHAEKIAIDNYFEYKYKKEMGEIEE